VPTYVVLLKLTRQGFSSVKGFPGLIERAKRRDGRTEARLVGIWLTLGQYDAVQVWEAPDDQAMAAQLLAAFGHGNETAVTLRAFDEVEPDRILGALP
jgi:uncharacterized protein with GYD domain